MVDRLQGRRRQHRAAPAPTFASFAVVAWPVGEGRLWRMGHPSPLQARGPCGAAGQQQRARLAGHHHCRMYVMRANWCMNTGCSYL